MFWAFAFSLSNLFKYNSIVHLYGRVLCIITLIDITSKGFWTMVVYPLNFMNEWMLFISIVLSVWICYKLHERILFTSSMLFLWLWGSPTYGDILSHLEYMDKSYLHRPKKKNPSYLTFAIYKRGSSVNGISFYQLHSSKLKTIIYLSLVKDVPSHCSSLNWIVRLARFIHRFEIFCMHIFPIH